MKTIRVLGIDPGSSTTGFGIIDQSGNQLKYVHSGVIKTNHLDSLDQKLTVIYKQLFEVITTYQPDTASVERIFHSINAHSSLILGHARGVVLLAMSMQNLSIYEYTPTEVKAALVGVGRATKCQVQNMVKILLNQKKKMIEDESDALAVSICHAHSHVFLSNQYKEIS